MAFDLFCLNLGFLISPRQRSRETDTEDEEGKEERGRGRGRDFKGEMLISY